jgi:D-3-phosphoglycerate dehydrogenase
MPEKFLVFAAEKISKVGLDLLRDTGKVELVTAEDERAKNPDALLPRIDALIVRSATKVNADYLRKCERLKVVGRAGVGVDNIDVEAATSRGILVMNTPGGNTISTAEQTLALMFAISRKTAHAHASVAAGKWDRKSFEGVELYGKKLSIIGMGRIGSEVARRAIALGMRVTAYDPYMPMSRARALQVELAQTVEELLPEADYITLHTPLTESTRNILNAKTLALCKKGVRIVNCARGGLIDEAALADALKAGHVAAAGLDVFKVEPLPADSPLRSAPNVTFTPHLGASTEEAQENVGVEVAEEIRDYLVSGIVRNAVNMPSLDAATLNVLRPYLDLGRRLGLLLSQLAEPHTERLTVVYHGTITQHTTAPVTRAVLEGFLRDAAGPEMNQVNVMRFAERLGLTVSDTKLSEPCDFSELMSVEVSRGDKVYSVAATFFGGQPRIVRLNGQAIEAATEGNLLVIENRDRPGIVGFLGQLLARHNLNIANMTLSRTQPGGTALSIFQLDAAPDKSVLAELLQEKDISSAKLIVL